MDADRRAKFEMLMNETREDINRIEGLIEDELAKIKERLAVLQNEKKTQLTVYGAYCQLLGLPNDLESQDDDDEDDE